LLLLATSPADLYPLSLHDALPILSVRDALEIAQERELDLVEVAPNAQPPVCRLMDYGKYLYEKQNRERESRKAQKQIEIKEVRLDRKSTRLNSSHVKISYAVFCLK